MIEQLERVRAFRSDVAPPGEAEVAAAREALMHAIRSEPGVTTATAHRVGASATAGGVGASATAGGVGASAGARRSDASVTTRRAGASRPRGWGRTSWRWPLRPWRLAAAAALAGVGIVVASLLGPTSVTSPQPALAAAMSRLADVAEGQEWIGIPGPGQYIYTESKGLSEGDTMATGPAGEARECAVRFVEHRQSWIATDGSGAISQGEEDVQFTSASDREQCAALGITDPSSQADSWSNSFAAGGLSFPSHDWHSLSTDPATLLVQLRKLDGGPRDPAEDFTHIGDFMRESDAPPAILAALYEAAALIPGVKLMGPQEDPTGRTGLAVAFPYPNGQTHSELIFNEQSGTLLAEETYSEEGKLSGWTAYGQSKIVDSHPAFPLSG